MLDLKALLSKILDALKVDYIVEQGTSGIWTYRKWSSGMAEAWCRIDKAQSIPANSWLNFVVYLPTFFVNLQPVVVCNGGGAGHIRCFMGYTNMFGSSGAYAIDSYIVNFDSDAVSAAWAFYYVKGTWGGN